MAVRDIELDAAAREALASAGRVRRTTYSHQRLTGHPDGVEHAVSGAVDGRRDELVQAATCLQGESSPAMPTNDLTDLVAGGRR